MVSGALLAISISSATQQTQPIGDSMRRAANLTETFYGSDWQLDGEALRVALVEPGKKLKFSSSFTKETVSFVFAGQTNSSKLEMRILDSKTQEVVDETDFISEGRTYMLPNREKTYTMEVANMGLNEDFVTVVQVTGGVGPQLPLSKIKFLASSQGHALWEMASSGDAVLPRNTPFLRAAVVPARGSFSAPIVAESPKSVVVGYGEEDTYPLTASILNVSGQKIKNLEDDGSNAQFGQFPGGIPKGAKIRLTNPTRKRVVYSWGVYSGK